MNRGVFHGIDPETGLIKVQDQFHVPHLLDPEQCREIESGLRFGRKQSWEVMAELAVADTVGMYDTDSADDPEYLPNLPWGFITDESLNGHRTDAPK